MARLLGFLSLTLLAALLPSCTSNEPEDPNRVSNIPWNRPEKWEGQGPLGGIVNQ
jgi:hypothetical protein